MSKKRKLSMVSAEPSTNPYSARPSVDVAGERGLITPPSTGQGWYASKRSDVRWQRRRAEINARAGWACEDCGRQDKWLEVHHTAYVRGKEPWDYPDELLMSLCRDCHEFRQSREDALRITIGRMTRAMKLVDLEEKTWAIIQQLSQDVTARENEEAAA